MSTPAPEHGEPAGRPVDRHPDGSPMTQDEIDRHWLAHVYRPNEPQLTPRAVVTGMLLGGVMSLSNLYVGLKTGWGLAVTVTAAVLAFGIFSSLRALLPAGPFKREFSSLENNTMASAASAAGYFTGAGMTSAIPALYMVTGRTLRAWELAAWILAISFLGVLLAVPMRRQMIDVDRLPFPEGMAYAETIRSLHASPGEGRRKATALLWGALAGAGVKLLSGIRGLLWPVRYVGSAPILPEHLPLLARWQPLTLGLQTDILMIGAGAMMGLRICVGLLLGAVVGWGVLGTWLHTHGLAGPAPTYATVRTWLVWPGVTLIVVNGLLAFGLKWRTAVAALAGLGRLARGAASKKADGAAATDMADVEVPTAWFARGLLACTALVVVLARVLFDIPLWMGLLATVMSILLSIVACRATGETSITPIGALGKITQFMYGALAAGNVTTNLMTASITAGAAMHSADLLTDLKGGYLLGARPRYQFLSQFFGILAGAVFCIPAYLLLATPERLGSPEFPAPAAKTWQAVAELLAGGVERTVRGPADASPAALAGFALDQTPAGTRAGDAVRVEGGPAAGTYRLEAVVNRALVLDRPLARADVVGQRLTVLNRGSSRVASARSLTAVALSAVPAGTTRGDYLLVRVNGHALWWAVLGRVGDTLAVDRPLADTRSGRALPAPVRVEVRKEALPPYALEAVLLAALLAVALTLVEVYAPARVRRWVPSVTGVGLGFVIAGFDAVSMFLGAVLAAAVARWRPKVAEDYTLAGASGIMAGASLAGILIIVLSQVARVIVTP